jgi:hypothetical protein
VNTNGDFAGAETIYREKISGARADRPQLAKLMASLKAGDVGSWGLSRNFLLNQSIAGFDP